MFLGVELSWLVILFFGIIGAQKDFGSQPSIIETDSLPKLDDGVTIDASRMPTVGNGHIATVVYSDSVYMNGIYNGELSRSHRARIPAEITLRVHFHNEQKKRIYRQYSLDMKNGYWEENITVEECRVTQRVYAHQYYTRLLVTEIFAQRQATATGNLMLYLNSSRGADSRDFNFTDRVSFNGGNCNKTHDIWCWHTEGTSKEPEIPGGNHVKIFKYWSIVPPIIHIPSYQNSIRYTYVMSVDNDDEVAKDSFVSGTWMADKNPDYFFSLHKETWQKKWEDGGIEISGNDKLLEKLVYSSYYYILSSLPSLDNHRPVNYFGGISATGLGYGEGQGSNDQGHVSWDQERWILPAILPFYPNLAKSMLSYRVNTMPAASAQAKMNNLQGLLYSWRSAATGIDVTPSQMLRNHYHLNGDISHAVRQYVSMTRDKLWLQEKGGCFLIRDLALLWYSKAEWNAKTRRYDIKGVAPPDEGAGTVDNSVYTNVIASLSLHYAKYAACLCNKDVNSFAPKEWITTAQNLQWEYNNSVNFIPEHNSFISEGVTNKRLQQPGAAMLSYPLMWKLSKSTKEKNLRLYYSAVPTKSPSTTWAVAVINWLELGDTSKAQLLFDTAYSKYISEPFKIWSEYPSFEGQRNHLSGMAAFLQVFIYGFGGLRIHLESLSMNPQLPANTHSLTFNDIDYLGSKFSIRYTSAMMQLTVKGVGIHPLVMTHNETGKVYHLVTGTSITLPKGPFTIHSKLDTGCPAPEDNILPTPRIVRSTSKPLSIYSSGTSYLLPTTFTLMLTSAVLL